MSLESELRGSIGRLDSTVGDLKVAAAELKLAAHEAGLRSREDRSNLGNLDARVSVLERWKARVQGQIALVYFLLGAVVATGTVFGILRAAGVIH